jgi:hypothetical protein
MRSDLCAVSYTLWAIFSPLEADRAESVLSQGLGPRIQPLPTSLFTRVRGRGILGTSPMPHSRKFRVAPALCSRSSYVELALALVGSF